MIENIAGAKVIGNVIIPKRTFGSAVNTAKAGNSQTTGVSVGLI